MHKKGFHYPATELLIDFLFDVVGTFIFSVGVQALSAPYQLPPGGVTGVAVIIYHLTGIPLSVMTLVINIPLLVLAFIFLGRKFTIKSLQTVLITSVMLEICGRFILPYQGDIMLAALFGGVLQGIGLALIFMRGSTTGGTDILSKLLQIPFPHLSMGRLLLVMDAIVLAATAVVYRSLSNALYALILVFVSTKVIDAIMFGPDRGRMLMIVSDSYEKIAEMIHEEMDRGSTLLQGTGTYTKKERPVLICAVSTHEFFEIKKIVYTVDPDAFIVTLETNEVLGEGFKPLLPQNK